MAAWGLQIWCHSTEVSGRYVAPAPFPSGKRPWGPLDRMFGVAQSRSGCGDQEWLSFREGTPLVRRLVPLKFMYLTFWHPNFTFKF